MSDPARLYTQAEVDAIRSEVWNAARTAAVQACEAQVQSLKGLREAASKLDDEASLVEWCDGGIHELTDAIFAIGNLQLPGITA